MANIQELDNQISIIEADKELLYDILTNKNIAGLSVLDSLETYVKSVSKLSNYAMYDFNTEADMNKSKSYPIGTYGLVIKEVAEESRYNDSTEDTLYTSFDVPTRVQDINYKKIADNQEVVININTDLGNTVGQLKITSIDARLNIKINTYTVKVQWNRIASEAGEYILSLYEINGVDDYKGGTNYILPEAVDLVLMTEIEDVDLKKSLLKFMPLKTAIYDSLNVYAQTGKWELLFKQLEYEVDTQIKVYNTLEEMNADTVDNYAIGIVLNTEEALRLTADVVQENRIYKQIILGPEVIVNVPKVATRLTYTYSDTNYDVTVTLVKESLDEDTRLVVLSSKDYVDAISEVTYTTDITYTYKVKTKVENTEYDVYTFEIDSKSTYDSKLGITERVNIDSSEFDRVEIDTPKTNTSSVTITSDNCEIEAGLYGKILYINNNQNNEDNHWEFSGIYMYNGNTWQALALGLNASASTIFTGYKAYTDSGTIIGTGTSDANAVATDIMSGKSAYVNGVKLIGTFSLDTELATQDSLLQTQTTSIEDVISALENKMATGLQEATSDATATAGDIESGKTAYVNGVKLTGTMQPIQPSVEPNDVNFYDYDGTIVASYSASDFANLSALPTNPTHTGLTSQGWNWTLADAKTYVASYGKLNIGQMYVTDDGATRIYIKLEEGRLAPYLGFAIDGTATVDWGDNTTSTVTGTDTTTIIYTQHIYANAGEYVISISSESDIVIRGANGYRSRLLTKNSTNNEENYIYQNAIQKIELGSNVTSIENYAFGYCRSLSSITIPNTVTSIGNTAFGRECIALSNIVIPNSMTSIGTRTFSYSYLSNIILPNSITSIEDSAFSDAYSLSNIIIPHSVTSIGSYLFQSVQTLANITIPNSITTFGGGGQDFAKGIAFVDFASFSSIPPTEASRMFSSNNMASDYKIIVPDNLYEDWIVAWSTLESHIIKESDWV